MADREGCTFVEQQNLPGRKTRLWQVIGSGGPDDEIGVVLWHGPWRQYIFNSYYALLAPSCLDQIARFCREHTDEHGRARRLDRLAAVAQAEADGWKVPEGLF